MDGVAFRKITLMLLLLLFSSVIIAEETVEYAAVIFRHGDRTPVDPYPTDPWRNESLWPVKFGELTNIGKSQHYALGKWLRKRYLHLLSDAFDPSEIYVRSTDVDRTLMSAQANLAGMYPPKGKSVWNPDLNWQPIPIHTRPEHMDEVVAMKKACPAYDREMEKFTSSKAYKNKLSQYVTLMDYLTAYTGRKIKNFADILSIYTTLYIESLYNFTLPDWADNFYPDKMREPACYSFSTSAATPLLARLKAGPLLKQVAAKIKAVMTCDDYTSKVSIYSGHDFTIGTLLTALGLFDGNCPVYTSTIIIELVYSNVKSISDSRYIRILYRNSTDIVEPITLFIPYCGKKCPVDRFMELYENLLTVNFDSDCAKQAPGLLLIVFFGGLGLFVLIYALHRYHYASVTRRIRAKMYYGIHNVPVTKV